MRNKILVGFLITLFLFSLISYLPSDFTKQIDIGLRSQAEAPGAWSSSNAGPIGSPQAMWTNGTSWNILPYNSGSNTTWYVGTMASTGVTWTSATGAGFSNTHMACFSMTQGSWAHLCAGGTTTLGHVSGSGKWHTVTSFPYAIVNDLPQQCLGLPAASGKYAMCVGGYSGATYHNSVELLNSSYVWSASSTNFPQSNGGASCVLYNNIIYCIGGKKTGATSISDVYYSTNWGGSWNPTTNITNVGEYSCTVQYGYAYCQITIGGPVYYGQLTGSGIPSWTTAVNNPAAGNGMLASGTVAGYLFVEHSGTGATQYSLAASPTTAQPLKVTMSNSAPSNTVTVNGCSPSPSTFAADGSVHSITMNPSCSFYLSFPAGNSTTRYGFKVSSLFNSNSANITSSTTQQNLTAYLQLNNTYTMTPSSPSSWDAFYSETYSGTYLGTGSVTLGTFSLALSGGAVSKANFSDYNTVVTLKASFASSVAGVWTASGTNSFTDTTGGHTHNVNYIIFGGQFIVNVKFVRPDNNPYATQRPTFFYHQNSTTLTGLLTTSYQVFVVTNGSSWTTTNPFTFNLVSYTPSPASGTILTNNSFISISYSSGRDIITVCGSATDPFTQFAHMCWVPGFINSYGNILGVENFLTILWLVIAAAIFLKSGNPVLTITILLIGFGAFSAVSSGINGTSFSFITSIGWQIALIGTVLIFTGTVVRLFVGRNS